MVLIVVHDVGVGNILCVYAATTFNQWQLLCVQVLIGVGSKAAAHWLLLILFIVAARGQVWQLLLGFAKLVVVLLFVGVDALNLIRTTHFNLSSMAAHII